jgi:hypothetical protein
MPRAKELKIRVKDQPGMLGEVASALGKQKVNLRALNAWIENDEGVIRLVADQAGVAKRILAKAGWAPEVREVLELELADKPGALGAVAEKLGKAGINLQYAYLGTAAARKATIFLGVPDVTAAMKAAK